MPDRRTILTGAGLGLALPLGASAQAAPTASPGTAMQALMLDMIADLPAVARGNFRASPAIARVLARGGRLASPLTAGRFIASADPLRLFALVPVGVDGAVVDFPLMASFVARADGTIDLVEVSESGFTPFTASASRFETAHSGLPAARVNWQAEYDRLASGAGGVLALPAGRLKMNLKLHSRRVHVVGAGRNATILQPADPRLPVLSAHYRDGSWNYVTIANLDLDGGGTGVSGFAAGSASYAPNDEFAGRTRFENVGFANFRTSISRTAGQIGLILEACVFGKAGVHLLSRAIGEGPGEAMHAGILMARDCHFSGATECVSRFESSVAGTGGVLFDNCIMERNEGIVFDIAGFANADQTTDFLVRDCWNEMNGAGARSRDVRTPYAAIRDAGMVRFEGTPVGPLLLRNSAVETHACPLDALSWIDVDADSTLRHHQARGFGSMVPLGLATSISAAVQSDPAGRALMFEMPPRDYAVKPTGGKILAASTAGTSETWLGSETIVSQTVEADATDRRAAQRIALPAGARVFPPPVAIGKESWIVWSITYRHVSGGVPVLQVTGDRGVSFARPAQSRQWQTLGGMAKVAAGAQEVSLWFSQGARSGVIDFDGYCLAAFARRQDALSFLNAAQISPPVR